MPTIDVPWGPDGSLGLIFPTSGPFSEAKIDVAWPDTSGPLTDYGFALEDALDHPVDDIPLEGLVKPGSSVAIVVDDPSRWTPVREALPIILKRLRGAGVRCQDITICVGVGRHMPVNADAMQRRVGMEIAAEYRCFSPPVDDLSAYDDLGETPQGIPIRVFRPVAQASLRILVGSVLPHLQAGFGGGYKLIFPGTSHRTTLGRLHREGIDGRSKPAGLLGDRAAGNAMRQAIHAAAALLGPCWSVSHLSGGRGQVFRIAAGHPERVQDILAEEGIRRLRARAAPLADLVVAGNDPWPGDPMQSFKVLLHHRAGCRSGGVLAGLFWTDPDEIDRSFPITALKCIAAIGRLGDWSIRRLLPLAHRIAKEAGSPAAFMMHWACELVIDRTVLVFSPALFARIGPRLGPVQIFTEQGDMWRAVAATLVQRPMAKAGECLRVRVFPQGGLTYVSETNELALSESANSACADGRGPSP
jgi:lactate racemase